MVIVSMLMTTKSDLLFIIIILRPPGMKIGFNIDLVRRLQGCFKAPLTSTLMSECAQNFKFHLQIESLEQRFLNVKPNIIYLDSSWHGISEVLRRSWGVLGALFFFWFSCGVILVIGVYGRLWGLWVS